MLRTASVSRCGRYRYSLGRRWAPGLTVCWVMLNPSTADAEVDDPTVRRCIGFAKRWGYAGLTVVNLYALRSPHPAALAAAEDPVGPDNADHLEASALDASRVIAAWGAHPLAQERGRQVAHELTRTGLVLECLGTTASGAPRHPLARGKSCVPSDAVPEPWRPA